MNLLFPSFASELQLSTVGKAHGGTRNNAGFGFLLLELPFLLSRRAAHLSLVLLTVDPAYPPIPLCVPPPSEVSVNQGGREALLSGEKMFIHPFVRALP